MNTDLAMPNAAPMTVVRRADAPPETSPDRTVLVARWSGDPLRCLWVAEDSEQNSGEIAEAAA